MSIAQFLRILWAYRLIVVVTTAIALAIGATTIAVVKPRYEAQSRVMLDVIKPDPVTGQVISTNFLKAYTKTQIELVKDQQVARKVVADLKWGTDPKIQAWFKAQDAGTDRDFNRWAAQQVMGGADAKLIEGSNILEISFASGSPDRAKTVADALRKAYLDLTLDSRRDTARRNAEWYEAQAAKAREQLMQAESVKSAYERESGIVLQDNQTDIDTARLAALAQQGPTPIFNAAQSAISPTMTQMAAIDSQISVAEKTLGPNHPQLLDLRRQRRFLETQLAMEQRANSAQSGAAAAAAAAASSMLETQKAKVMSQRDKVEKLRLMQGEIDLRRQQHNNAVTRAAQLRQEAEVAVTGVTPLGAAITPRTPIFPNKGLILGSSIAAGLGIGLAAALLLEFMGRRVRSADDVVGALGTQVLAVVRSPKVGQAPWWTLNRWLPKQVAWRAKAAGA